MAVYPLKSVLSGVREGPALAYRAPRGVEAYVREVAAAEPLQLVGIEREGVEAGFVKDLARRMDVPATRLFAILGVPRATAEKKASAKERIGGIGGVAALGLIRLMGVAQEIAAASTHPDAAGLDVPRWLGRWIEQPQPALGGRRPAELLDTPTGAEVVTRLLGSMASGTYQ